MKILIYGAGTSLSLLLAQALHANPALEDVEVIVANSQAGVCLLCDEESPLVNPPLMVAREVVGRDLDVEATLLPMCRRSWCLDELLKLPVIDSANKSLAQSAPSTAVFWELYGEEGIQRSGHRAPLLYSILPAII